MGQTILIGGTSHTGKSTLAAALGDALGWPVVSTDSLARHPGRPWPAPKPHVAEVYTNLSTQTLVTLLQHHHHYMRPLLKQLAIKGPVILEGNAVRPEFWPDAAPMLRARICLTAPPDTLRDRMMESAGATAGENARLIEAFWNRSVADQTDLVKTATAQSWTTFDLSEEGALDDVLAMCS